MLRPVIGTLKYVHLHLRSGAGMQVQDLYAVNVWACSSSATSIGRHGSIVLESFSGKPSLIPAGFMHGNRPWHGNMHPRQPFTPEVECTLSGIGFVFQNCQDSSMLRRTLYCVCSALHTESQDFPVVPATERKVFRPSLELLRNNARVVDICRC